MTRSALLVMTTVPDRRTARALADAALDAAVVACVSVSGPIRSHYFWKGRRESATEFVLTFKLPSRGYARLEALLRSLHPYECPEIIALPVQAGAGAYLKWLEEQVSRRNGPKSKKTRS